MHVRMHVSLTRKTIRVRYMKYMRYMRDVKEGYVGTRKKLEI